jgi:CRP-like cAMP-binding protein
MALRFNQISQGLGTMFRRKDQDVVQDAVDTLQQVSIFKDLTRRSLRHLAQVMHYRDYKPDEYIYHLHDPGLGLYVIQQGQVRLLIEDEDGKTHVIGELDAYTIFGEASLISESRRAETAYAMMPTRLLGFFRPDLDTLAKRYPKVGVQVAIALAQHMTYKQERLKETLSRREDLLTSMRIAYGFDKE